MKAASESLIHELRPKIQPARQFKEAAAEIFTANAQLLALQRDQSRAVAKLRKAMEWFQR